jgi:hypothetical protein
MSRSLTDTQGLMQAHIAHRRCLSVFAESQDLTQLEHAHG